MDYSLLSRLCQNVLSPTFCLISYNFKNTEPILIIQSFFETLYLSVPNNTYLNYKKYICTDCISKIKDQHFYGCSEMYRNTFNSILKSMFSSTFLYRAMYIFFLGNHNRYHFRFFCIMYRGK